MNPIEDLSTTSILTIIYLVFGWGLGYFGQPHIVTKFMGIRNAKELVKSKYVGMIWMFFALSAAAFVGLVGIGFFKGQLAHSELVFCSNGPSTLPSNCWRIYPMRAYRSKHVDDGLTNSMCASVLGEDFYRHFFKKDVSQEKLLKVTRFCVVLVALCSLAIAFRKSHSLLDAFLYAWSGLGASFGPLMLMSLYYKKSTRLGAIAGIFVGGSISGLWHFVNPYLFDHMVLR